MPKDKKKFNKIILFFVIIISIFTYSVTYAALEVKYPNIPGYITPNPDCTGSDCLGIFLSYWFGFGIYIAGVMALISLVIAGVRYMTSAGNSGAMGEAKERIKGAVLGLVLVVSSFIIIKTINPVLVTPTLTPLPGVAGVFYTNGAQEKSAPISESNVAKNKPQGFNSIIYKCTESGGGTGPVLLFWQWADTDFQNFSEVRRLSCGDSVVPQGSFKMAFETPGLYFFLNDECTGFMSDANIVSQSELQKPFAGQVKSIRVINDLTKNLKYGFIAHKEINYRGDCEIPHVVYSRDSDCISIKVPPKSIDIFNWNSDTKSSGNGITFYSEPFGKALRTPGSQSGYYKLGYESIQREEKQGVWDASSEKINFIPSYDSVSVLPGYKENCPNFGRCPGSIKIDGHYIVSLYSGNPGDTSGNFCSVYKEDVPNFNAEEFAEGKKIQWVYVIPIK